MNSGSDEKYLIPAPKNPYSGRTQTRAVTIADLDGLFKVIVSVVDSVNRTTRHLQRTDDHIVEAANKMQEQIAKSLRDIQDGLEKVSRIAGVEIEIVQPEIKQQTLEEQNDDSLIFEDAQKGGNQQKEGTFFSEDEDDKVNSMETILANVGNFSSDSSISFAKWGEHYLDYAEAFGKKKRENKPH